MDDTLHRLIFWHQEEIKRLTGMLSDVYVYDTQDNAPAAAEPEPTQPLSNGTTQQPNYYSPLSSWEGGNDTAPVSPAPLSPDMFASQTAWPSPVPETPSLKGKNAFGEILDMLASDDEEPTQ
jgi:hypothetical protein